MQFMVVLGKSRGSRKCKYKFQFNFQAIFAALQSGAQGTCHACQTLDTPLVCYERGLLWTWSVMNVVCYEHDLLWTWSVMNRSVINVVCFQMWSVMNIVCYEHCLLWTLSVMNIVCYEHCLLWTCLLWTWSVMNRSVMSGSVMNMVCYEGGLLWTRSVVNGSFMIGLLRTWSVLSGLLWLVWYERVCFEREPKAVLDASSGLSECAGCARVCKTGV